MDDFQAAIRRLAESGSDDLLTLLTLAGLDPREDLAGLDLRGITLRRVNLGGADLSGVDLRTVDLSEANLERANLSEANLRGANLSGARLRDTNLSGADLSGADLRGADLGEGDLSGSNLKRAKLGWAILRKVTLRGARLDLASVIWIWVSRFGLDRWFGRSSGERDAHPQARCPKFFALWRRLFRPQIVALIVNLPTTARSMWADVRTTIFLNGSAASRLDDVGGTLIKAQIVVPALGWLVCLVLVAVNLIPPESAQNMGLGFLSPPAVRLAERRTAEAEQARRNAERRATDAEAEVEKLRSDVGAEKRVLIASHGAADRYAALRFRLDVHLRDLKLMANLDSEGDGLYLPTVLSATCDTREESRSDCMRDGKLKQANRSWISWAPSSLDTREFRLADLQVGDYLRAADLGKATVKEMTLGGSSVIGSKLSQVLEDAAKESDTDLSGDCRITRPPTGAKMLLNAQTGQLITSDAGRSLVFLLDATGGDRVTTGPGRIVCYCDGGGGRKAEKKIDIRWMKPVTAESSPAPKPAAEAKPPSARMPIFDARDF